MRTVQHRHPLVLVRLVLAACLRSSSLRRRRRHTQADGPSPRSTRSPTQPPVSRSTSGSPSCSTVRRRRCSSRSRHRARARSTERRQFFPAVADGVPGHYVATVTFPVDAGSYQWRAHMGWFGSYELGSIDVAAATTAAAGRRAADRSGPICVGSPSPASIVLGGVALVDLVVARRRRRTAAGVSPSAGCARSVPSSSPWSRSRPGIGARARQSRTDRPPSSGDGAQLFRAKGCATCHDGPDSTAQFVDFPSLANAPSWAGDRRSG